MDQHQESPSPVELAAVVGSFVAGLTTLTIQLFPFALPLLILVIAPLALIGLVAAVLVLPILLPLWLGRRILLARRRRREQHPAAPDESISSRQGTSGARGPRPIARPPSAGRA
jgi:hypothetical protein